jgi:hypothetical protein
MNRGNVFNRAIKWRDKEEDQDEEEEEEKGPTYHWIVDKTQFHFSEGGTACASISLMIVRDYVRRQKKIHDVKDMHWMEAMKKGICLWEVWYEETGGKRHLQNTLELYEFDIFKRICATLTKVVEFSGPLHKAPTDFKLGEMPNDDNDKDFLEVRLLDFAVDALFHQEEANLVGVFTYDATTFSLIQRNKNEVWLFDSHGGNNNDPRYGSYSVLASFGDPSTLTSFIRKKFGGYYSNTFQQYTLVLFKKRDNDNKEEE